MTRQFRPLSGICSGLLLAASLLVAACGTSGAATADASPRASGAVPSASSRPIPTAATPEAGSTTGPASPPAGFAVFASTRYGYALARPAGWTAVEAPGSGGVHPGEPGTDTFDGRTGRILTVTVEPVAAAASTTSWTCAVNLHLTGDHHLAVEAESTIDVGGGKGSLRDYHLTISPYVTHYLTVEVVRGALGFTFALESTLGRDAEDEALLRQIISTVRFDTP